MEASVHFKILWLARLMLSWLYVYLMASGTYTVPGVIPQAHDTAADNTGCHEYVSLGRSPWLV